jgi:hypothetical protein
MIVTYSPAGKDLYIYLTDVNPGEAARSVKDVPVRMLFDGEHQWIGFEIIEAQDDGSVLDLETVLDRARRHAPELTLARDAGRAVMGVRWTGAEASTVLPWDVILDFDPQGQLVGFEFVFGGVLEIDGRLGRLPHQRI